MSFSQTVLQWIAEQAFPIVFIFCSLVLAYLVYAAAFRRRVLPRLLKRRVAEVLTPASRMVVTESGSRPAATESGIRSAVTASGIRPITPTFLAPQIKEAKDEKVLAAAPSSPQ